MYKDIEEAKKRLANNKKTLEDRTKNIVNIIAKSENELKEKIEEFHKVIIEDIDSSVYEIRNKIENNYDMLFDGYYIDRKNNNIKLFVSYMKEEKFELVLESAKFVNKNETESEDAKESIEYLLNDLNTYLSYQ
jgi:hypothetical protein